MPLKGREVTIFFNYTGTPALRELQLWPDLVRVNISMSSSTALANVPVLLEGNITKKTWIDIGERGSKAQCIYQWNGSCVPCAGTGCEPDNSRYPGIGKPNWALIPWPKTIAVPFVGGAVDVIESVVKKVENVTGTALLPPQVSLPVPVFSTQKGSTFTPDWNWIMGGLLSLGYDKLLDNAWDGKEDMQRFLKKWFPIGYILAVDEATQTFGQCSKPGEAFLGLIPYCYIDFWVWTWWNIDSIPEPDPDGAGGYAYSGDSCVKVSGVDEYLANTGVWSFIRLFTNEINKNVQNGINTRRTDMENQMAEGLRTCASCQAGFNYGTGGKILPESIKGEAKTKCEAAAGAAELSEKVCVNINSREARTIAADKSCDSGEITITTYNSCGIGSSDNHCREAANSIKFKNRICVDAYTAKAEERSAKCFDNEIEVTTRAGCTLTTPQSFNGKWCARKISIDLSESEASAAENRGQPVTRVQINDATQLQGYPPVAKCILSDEECPTDMPELKSCSSGKPYSYVVDELNKLRAKATGDCPACESKRLQWCTQFKIENNRIDDVTGYCVAKANDCNSPDKIMSCTKYDNYRKNFVTAAPIPPPPSGTNRCKETIDYYKDAPVDIGFCYDPNAPTGGSTSYHTDCNAPKVFAGKGEDAKCEQWSRLVTLGGIDGIYARAQTLRQQIKTRLDATTDTTQKQNLQLLLNRVDVVITSIEDKKLHQLEAQITELENWNTELKALENATGSGDQPMPLSLNPASKSCTQNVDCGITTITVTGGTGTISYTSTLQAPGMTFGCSGTICTLSGTPTQTGTFTYTIKDSSTPQKNATFTLTVTSVDTTKPTITHTPVTTATVGQAITITATIRDNVGIRQARLHYGVEGGSFKSIIMNAGTDDTYSAPILSSDVTTAGVKYFISAVDDADNYVDSPPGGDMYTITVTAAAQPSGAAPTIEGVSPRLSGVAVESAISVTFSEAMDKAATQGAFSTAPVVTCPLFWSSNNKTLYCVPTFDMSPGTDYNVNIGTGAKDRAGNALAVGYTWSFTTGGVAAPTGLRVTSAGASWIAFLWQPVANVDGYNVYRCGETQPFHFTIEPNANVTNLVPYVEYCFQVTAIRGGNESLKSPELRTMATPTGTGSATASSVSELGEIPTAPSTSQSFGWPVTGAAAKLSSLGPLSATGLATTPIGISTPSLSLLAAGSFAQMKFATDMIEILKQGATVYRRQYTVQPSLGNSSIEKCAATDSVFGLKRPKGATTYGRTPAALIGMTIEDSDYMTMENLPTGYATMLNVTIRGNVNASNCSAAGNYSYSEIVPSNYSGIAGYFKFYWNSPPCNGTYTVDVRPIGPQSVVIPTKLRINVIPHPTPFFTVAPTTVCTKPGIPQSLTAATINVPQVQFAGSEYNISVCKYASLSGGVCNPTTGIGIISTNANGDHILVATRSETLQPNSSYSYQISSNVDTGTLVGIVLRNDTVGPPLWKNFTHKIVTTDARIVLNATDSETSQPTLTQHVYGFNLTSFVPSGCTPSTFAIVTEPPEPPATGGWAIIANSTIDLSTTSSKLFDVSVRPVSPSNMGDFPTYVLATSNMPARLGTGEDAVAVVADEQYLYYTSTTNRLKRFDLSTSQSLGDGLGIGARDTGGIAADYDYIYYASEGTISRALKSTLGTSVPTATGAVTAGSQLAVDNTYIWWLEPNAYGTGSGRIKRASKTATTACANGCLWANVTNATDIAVDNNYVYWTDGNNVKQLPRTYTGNNTTADATLYYANKRASRIVYDAINNSFYAGLYAVDGKSKIVHIVGNGSPEDPMTGWVTTPMLYSTRDYAYAIGRNAPTDIAIGLKVAWIENGRIYVIDRDTLTDWALVWYRYCRNCAPFVTIRPLGVPAGTADALAPAGETATYLVNITSTIGIPIPGWTLSITSPPANWSAILSQYSIDLGAAGSSTESTAVYAYVASPANATPGYKWNFTIMASKGGVSRSSDASYTVSPHVRPSITTALIDPTQTTVYPNIEVGWELTVNNTDPSGFAASNITLTVDEATKPANWTTWFQIGTSAVRLSSATVTVNASQSDTSAKFYAQSLKSSEDGPYTITLLANISGLFNSTNVTYTVFGCGNGLCEPERGEYNLSGPKWCAADCEWGYTKFRCTFVGQSGSKTWIECDKTYENYTRFELQLANVSFDNLMNQSLRACKRGVNVSDCAASACGLTGSTMQSCISSSNAFGIGLLGSDSKSWSSQLNCPTDSEGDYYLLFSGVNSSLVGFTTVYTTLNSTSANFSFSCPNYGIAELQSAVLEWTGLHTNCIAQLQNVIGQTGATSDCTRNQRRVCELRHQYISNMSAVISNPTATAAQNVRTAKGQIESQISALLQHGCFGISVLEIVGSITPPSTIVGEISPIRLVVNNTQDVDYRGYANCSLRLPDSSHRTESSGCTLFSALSSTNVTVPVTLTLAGNWTIESCTIFADLASAISETNCMNAPSFFDRPANVPFTVDPANAAIVLPLQDSNLSGTVPIEVNISGNFASVKWAYSSTSPTCANAPSTNLVNTTSGFTKSYTGTWDTTAVADRQYYLCIQGTIAGYTSTLGVINVTTNNYRFTFNPTETNVNVVAREPKTFALMLSNTGTAADQYAISCSAPSQWQTTMKAGANAVSCGSVLNVALQPGQNATINVTVNVPAQQTGSAIVNVTASSNQGNAITVRQQMTITGVSNAAPVITNAFTTPNTTLVGSTITFRATISDPNGDAITAAQACADATCTTVLCNMTGAAARTCNGAAGNTSGRKQWWVYAIDSLGLSSTFEGTEFVVLAAANINQATSIANANTNIIGGQVSTPSCPSGYSCLASCEPNIAFCVNRTDYGPRNCGSGLLCCKEQEIPNCALSPAACSVQIESKRCIWDPVALNYSITVQASWSGGKYMRISAGGVTSPPIGTQPAILTVRSATGGSKDIAATVYSATDGLQCSNTTSVACVTPDKMPAASPLPGLPISLATASSFTPGNSASRSIDDDPFTAWQSAAETPQWLKLDLGFTQTINGVGIFSSSGKPREFTVSASQNDISYTRIASVHAATYTSDWNVTSFGAVDARYVLINVTSADDVTSIYEAKVYGTAVTTAAPLPITPTPGIPMYIYVLVVAGIATAVILLAFHRRLALWWSFERG
jgi:hypothetical protein